jgi:uncharacterized protein (TIGR04255 family)
MPCGLEMGYKKPTIIEIYIECFLAPSTLTVSRLFEIVPVLKEKGFTDIELQPSFQVATGEPNLQPRIRCWSGDRKKLIQLSQDNLVVNLVGDYPGWRAFTELLESAVSAVCNSIGEFAIVSMNLNTIDRFSVPVKSYVFDHYVNCGGKMVPEWYKGSREALDITLGRGLVKEDTWNRRINVKVRRRDPVVIEFRVGLHNVVTSGKSWKAVLETLHDESNEIFESLITDSTRSEIMGGFVE